LGLQTEVRLDCVDRVELLAGPTGRRSWPDAVKCRIVAESMVPGASVAEVARRYGLGANHLSTWRGLAKRGELGVPGFEPLLPRADFATVVLDEEPNFRGRIELETGGVTLRLDANTAVQRIADLVVALKAAP
jgi:transposase